VPPTTRDDQCERESPRTIPPSCDPNVLEILESLTSQQRKLLLDALDNYKQTKDLTKFLEVFEAVVGGPVRKLIDSGTIPDRLVQDALEVINPADLSSFPTLNLATQEKILELTATKPVQELMSALGHTLEAEFNTSFNLWRIQQAFVPTLNDFSVRLLADGFQRYKLKGKARNAVQWATQLRPGNKYFDECVRVMGPGFADVLKQTEQYWEVPAKAMSQIAAVTTNVDMYWKLRETASGIGRWMQADHCIERRFLNHHPELRDYFLDTDDIRSILVPVNEIVADSLRQAKVTGFMCTP
jgi:hypothetical protein